MIGYWIILGIVLHYSVNGDETRGPPVISKNIIRETKPVGETGRLKCTVANLGTNMVFWTRQPPDPNGDPILISQGLKIATHNPLTGQKLKKYEVLEERSKSNEEITYTLIIRSLVQDDDGKYTCNIMIKGESHLEQPHRDGILMVQRPPLIMRGRSTSTSTATVGDSVTLECHANGRPEPIITWSRNKGTLKDPEDNKQVLRVKNTTSYTINNVTAADRGMYRCMADNNVKPPALYMVMLFVNHKPVIKAFRNHVGQAPDKNLEAEMACKVMGHPDPEVTWWRQLGETWIEISDDAYHKIDKLYGHGPNLDVLGSWSALRIRNIKMGDFGKYKCRGENIYGSTEEFIKFFMTTTCQGANCNLAFDTRRRNGAETITAPSLTLILTIAWIHRMLR